MISCPVQIQGRVVGAVAVGFGAEIDMPAREAAAGLKRGADGFEGFIRSTAAPAAAAAPVNRANYAPGDALRTQTGAAPGRTQLGPIPVAPPPPSVPASAIALRPTIPTLREPADRTVELAPANSGAS